MSGSYMPSADQDFSAWADNFVDYAAAHHAALGLSVDDISTLEPAHPDWDTKLAAQVTAQAAARAATAAKNDARAVFEDAIRPLVTRIQINPDTTDADREALGLKPRSLAMASPDMGMSDERPLPIIDISTRLKHVLRVQTLTNTGTKKARPAGTLGCELWRKIGEQPSGVADMEYVGIVKKTPYLLQYESADAGKMAHYALRWINSKGEPGSWSETESATIAA